MSKNTFRVGYGEAKITPPMGMPIAGYYVPRFAKGKISDLRAIVLAMTCGKQKLLLISGDVCAFYRPALEKVREVVAAVTGIGADRLFIAATHTHTGPCLNLTGGFAYDPALVLTYIDFMAKQIAKAAVAALKDLKPAKMGYAVGHAPDRIAYIRRYRMKDGSVMTCPPVGDPNIDHPLGHLDQRVNVLRFDRRGGETIVLMNYGLHADTTNGELISSDWVGWVQKTLDKCLDGVKCVCVMGAEGDVGSTHVFPGPGDMNDTEISFDNEMKSPGMARFVGRALAGTVLQVYDKVAYVDVDRLSMVQHTLSVALNVPDEKDLPRARQYAAWHEAGRDDLIPFKAMELTTVVAEAMRMVRMAEGPATRDMTLTGLRIGPVALIGLPGEPFTEIGERIKDIGGFDLILPCALTNGSEGYFPSAAAYGEGGYEARTSPFKSTVSDTLVENAAILLDKLK